MVDARSVRHPFRGLRRAESHLAPDPTLMHDAGENNILEGWMALDLYVAP